MLRHNVSYNLLSSSPMYDSRCFDHQRLSYICDSSEIAYTYCPFSATEDEASIYGAPNYKASCRSVAYGVCEGAIYGYVRENGCSISTSKLDDLQDVCEPMIDSMTGGDELKMELIKAPSAKPEKKVALTEGKSKSNMSCDGDFNDGVYLGAEVAEKMWKEMGSSCSNIWGFEDKVEDYIEVKYPTDTSDWRKNSCHQGVEAGADQVVDKYEKQCLDDSPDECNDLGQAAAQRKSFYFDMWDCYFVIDYSFDPHHVLSYIFISSEIAYAYCPFSATEDEASIYGAPNYKASCRSVAYGVCEGAIYGYVRQNGCSISTSKLDDLQDECEDLIDAMTGGETVLAELLRKKVTAVSSQLRTN